MPYQIWCIFEAILLNRKNIVKSFVDYREEHRPELPPYDTVDVVQWRLV